jgi:predicted DsbA family dithiol-disulfide isomerase
MPNRTETPPLTAPLPAAALVVEVFAEVGCPFTHVVLRRFVAERKARGRASDVLLRLKAWPLELVNGRPMSSSAVAVEVAAIRAQVEPTMFSGFAASAFPRSTMAALAFAADAAAKDLAAGESVSLELRDRLFERGEDISSNRVLFELATAHGLAVPPADFDEVDRSAVRAEHEEGRARGVAGSPHFFVGDDDFFCPAHTIEHTPERGYEIADDPDGWSTFLRAVFG